MAEGGARHRGRHRQPWARWVAVVATLGALAVGVGIWSGGADQPSAIGFRPAVVVMAQRPVKVWLGAATTGRTVVHLSRNLESVADEDPWALVDSVHLMTANGVVVTPSLSRSTTATDAILTCVFNARWFGRAVLVVETSEGTAEYRLAMPNL